MKSESMDPSATTLARLERLESKNRRLAAALVALSVVVAGLLAAGFAAPARLSARGAEKELFVERLVLVDAAGAELATLAADSAGAPALILRQGKASATLTANGPGLQLRAADGKKGAWLGADGQGAVGLSLNGEKVVDGLRLTVKPNGSAGAYLLSADGRERLALELLENGSAGLNARDTEGIPRFFSGITGDALPSLALLDARGAKRAGLVLLGNGMPLLSFDDDRGQSRIELGQRFDGHARVRVLDATGKVAFETP
jgi:hypothetical protein